MILSLIEIAKGDRLKFPVKYLLLASHIFCCLSSPCVRSTLEEEEGEKERREGERAVEFPGKWILCTTFLWRRFRYPKSGESERVRAEREESRI